MPTSTTTIQTARASIYLQQLCKHFGHKVPVEVTPEHGRIELPFGLCHLAAEDDALTMTVEGDPAEIARLEKVVGDISPVSPFARSRASPGSRAPDTARLRHLRGPPQDWTIP